MNRTVGIVMMRMIPSANIALFRRLMEQTISEGHMIVMWYQRISLETREEYIAEFEFSLGSICK